MKAENLMKKSLNSKYVPKERAEAFNKIYLNYVKEKGNDKGWDKFRENLRKRYANPLNKKQIIKFGLTKSHLKNSEKIMAKNISKKEISKFPVDLFYRTAFSIIRKVLPKEAKILDIGYGDYPSFINLLNKKGYFAFGIEPFPKEFDKKRSFKATMKNPPKTLARDYDLILINMVYSINYTDYFKKNFEWELKNKKKLIKRIASLIKKRGYLLLVDDIGTIFSKEELKRYFNIILFEKDAPNNSGRITFLIRKR